MVNLKKMVLVAFSVLGLCSTLTGCGKTETQKYAVCKSTESYDVRYGYEFKLADNGKNIEEIKFIQTVNEENIKTVYPDKDLEETYKAFKDDMEYQYLTYTKGNENLAWFKAKFDVTESEHYAQLTFVFDTTNELLDMNDESTIRFLQEFAVNMFYNPDEKAFLYDEEEFINKIPLKNIYKVGCSIEERETK